MYYCRFKARGEANLIIIKDKINFFFIFKRYILQSKCSDFVAASAQPDAGEHRSEESTHEEHAGHTGHKRKRRQKPPFPHTLHGDFRHHPGFQSKIMEYGRNIVIYLPPGYDLEVDRRYPVLYMHDGQNLFDSATAFNGQEWEFDETAQRAILEGEVEPLIVVGIYNTGEHRIDDYTPTFDRIQKRGGKADLYGQFIVEELKPFVDRRYRTLATPEFTGLGGSSLGGLITLYLGLRYPHIFSRLMIMSPSVWWDHAMILKFVDHLKAKPTTSIWLDIGTREGNITPNLVRKLRDILTHKGWRLNADLKFMEVPGGVHNEKAWGDRVEPALKFLYPAD